MGYAAYYSKNNISFLNDKGITEILWRNKRNTKDQGKLEKMKFSELQKKHYGKRIKVENNFSWKELAAPRTNKVYDKNLDNFLNTIHLVTFNTLFNRRCV